MNDSLGSYRAAIIGLGFIGGADQVSGDALGQLVADLDGTHVAAMENHPRVEIVAGSSRDEGRRRRFEQRTGARTFADWREMLASEPFDIVSVATYAPQHAEMTSACAERRVRAVFCEKPIATRLNDAERMVADCERAGTLLAINHNRRFNANCRRLRDFVAAGELGELTSVLIQWGSGRLGNVGTHMFDATCMITGRGVEAVSATLDLSRRPDCRGDQFADPGGWGMLKLEGGLIATFDAADHARIPALITLNGTHGRAMTAGPEVRIEFWDGRGDHWPKTNVATSSMDVAMNEIVACLDGESSFPYDANDALHTFETIVACHASHGRNAAWTELPLRGEDRDIEVKSG